MNERTNYSPFLDAFIKLAVIFATLGCLLNIGSCGLHVIHNSFRDGCSAAEWEFETLFSSVRWLFKDSPSCREDYTSVTGSTSFPLDFFRHHWLENVPVVERALESIPFVVQYVTAAKSGEVTESKSKSFENVQQSVQDSFSLQACCPNVSESRTYLILGCK